MSNIFLIKLNFLTMVKGKSVIMVMQVVNFSSRGYQIGRFLPKNQCKERKLLNFENCCNSGAPAFVGKLLRSLFFLVQSIDVTVTI